jgi:outer membrane usher protein
MEKSFRQRLVLSAFAGSLLLGSAAQQSLADSTTLTSSSYQPAGVRASDLDLDAPPPSITSKAPGDYDFSYDKNNASSSFTLFDLKRAEGPGTITSSFAGAANSTAPVLTRLDSSWNQNVPQLGGKLKLGDSISTPGAWGQAVRFGGLQLGNAVATTRSDLITSPVGSQGAAIVPTTADLFLQGAQSPDKQSLSRPIVTSAPVVTGNGQISTGLQDSFGRTQTLTQSLTSSSTLLARGKSDYSVELGRVREDYATESNHYGDWFAATTMRYGLNKTTTIEGHAAQLDANSVYGVNVAKRVAATDIVSAAVASSRDPEATGWLAKFGVEHTGPTVTLALRSRMQSSGYRELGELPGEDEVQRRTLASASMKLGSYGSIGVAGATQVTTGNQHQDLYALTHSMPLGSFGAISTSAGYSSSNYSSVLFSFVHSFSDNGPKNATTLFDLNDWSLAANRRAGAVR